MPGKGSSPSRHNGETRTTAKERLLVELLLREQRVRVVFQPIVDLARNEVIGYEALTRPGESSGFANPLELFDAASRGGLLWELEDLARRCAIQTAAQWETESLLFLNCNPEVAADPRFPDEILKHFDRTSWLRPANIVMEVTERAETHRSRRLLENIMRLRAEGMQIAIDDVGAGANGLQRIMELRPNWLKLDRELITSIDTDPYQQNLLDVMLRFARISGVRLIAEGIERREQLATLLDLGVQHVQGFLLGRPAETPQPPDPALCAWVQQQTELGERKLRSPNLTFVADIMREAVICDGRFTLAQARSRLKEAPEASGLVIALDARHRAWLPRERAVSAEMDPLADQPLRRLGARPAASIASTTLISEALLLVSTRPVEQMGDSLIVEHAGEALGEVAMRDLLREAARITGDTEGGSKQMAGLPGRVQCDRRVASMIRRREPLHAIYIDIRKFNAYNERYGFQTGDLILRILAGVVTNSIGGEFDSDSEFAGHLGDDRFLILTTASDPGALARQIIADFESATDRFVACTESPALKGPETPEEPRAGLRVLLVRSPAERCQTGGDLHRMAWTLRDEGALAVIGRSHLFDAEADQTGSALRLSA